MAGWQKELLTSPAWTGLADSGGFAAFPGRSFGAGGHIMDHRQAKEKLVFSSYCASVAYKPSLT